MQIEVVDDVCEDADVKALVAKIGGGRVKYYHQPTNVGSLWNFETCIDRSRGKLIHLLHGDDRLKKDIMKLLVNYLEVTRKWAQRFADLAILTLMEMKAISKDLKWSMKG